MSIYIPCILNQFYFLQGFLQSVLMLLPWIPMWATRVNRIRCNCQKHLWFHWRRKASNDRLLLSSVAFLFIFILILFIYVTNIHPIHTKCHNILYDSFNPFSLPLLSVFSHHSLICIGPLYFLPFISLAALLLSFSPYPWSFFHVTNTDHLSLFSRSWKD